MKKLLTVSFLGAAFLFANTSFAEEAAPAKKEEKKAAKAKKGEKKEEAPKTEEAPAK